MYTSWLVGETKMRRCPQVLIIVFKKHTTCGTYTLWIRPSQKWNPLLYLLLRCLISTGSHTWHNHWWPFLLLFQQPRPLPMRCFLLLDPSYHLFSRCGSKRIRCEVYTGIWPRHRCFSPTWSSRPWRTGQRLTPCDGSRPIWEYSAAGHWRDRRYCWTLTIHVWFF